MHLLFVYVWLRFSSAEYTFCNAVLHGVLQKSVHLINGRHYSDGISIDEVWRDRKKVHVQGRSKDRERENHQ